MEIRLEFSRLHRLVSLSAGFLFVIAASLSANAAPNISLYTPKSGPVGMAVVIIGSGFGATQGASKVTFGGVPVTYVTWSTTELFVQVPAGAPTGNIVVSVAGVASNSVPFAVSPPPLLTAISPTSGVVGTSVTFTGINFTGGGGSGPGAMFNPGIPVSPTSWSDTQVVAPVPVGATTGPVVIQSSGPSSNGLTFTVTSNGPSITYVSPRAVNIGTPVTITGANFGTTQGTSTVTFDGIPATPTSWSATSIVVPVPSGTTNGFVTVTVAGVASNNGAVVVGGVAPSISSLSVLSGKVGTSVTITGSNFGSPQGMSAVYFNGESGYIVSGIPTSWSDTSIKVPVPAGAITGPVGVSAGGLLSNTIVFGVTSPSITYLLPNQGAVGAPVTIGGAQFGATQGNSTITFNGTAATPTSWSDSSITVPVPAGAASGSVIVKVGGVASNSFSFTVLSTLSVTSITPTSGSVGTLVAITGTNFGTSQGSSTVTFNGVTGTPTLWSNTQIQVPVPVGATTGPLVVTVGGVASNGITFTVNPAPTITSLSPNVGPVATVVTIAGNNFGSTQGSSTVTFNGNAAVPSAWSNNSITVPVPIGASTGPVVVTVAGVASNGVTFTVSSSPVITSLSPNLGLVGAVVTIAGGNFGSSQGSSTVTFNGTRGTPSSWTASSITVPVPSGASTGPVVVTVGGVASNGVIFTVSSAPVITSVLPNIGSVGTIVTISGNNFGSAQGSSTVSFNGTAATPSAWSNTSIIVPVPTGTTTGNVLVTVGGVGTNGVLFTVGGAAPSITSLSPTSGVVGSPVTIGGTNFGSVQSDSQVTFNGALTTATNWSPTSVGTQVPAGATTGKVVVTVLGMASNGSIFTITAGPPPSITSVAPVAGPVGATVEINGSNFGTTQGSSTVTFNGVTASPIWWTTGLIVTTVPTGATNGNVVVTVGGVKSNNQTFLVGAAPIVTGVYSNAGSLTVGSTANVYGSNFGSTQGTSALTFNGGAITPTSWNAGQINFVIPTTATLGNTNSVLVTVSGLQSNIYPLVVSPKITGITPDLASNGTSVTISGTNFGSTQGGGAVYWGGNLWPGTPTSWNNTTIVVPVPAAASSGYSNVNVVGAYTGGSLSSAYFPFMVGTIAPSITSLSATSGPIGSTLTINGANLGGGYVTFNNTPVTKILSQTDTAISVVVPTGATTGNVVVDATGGGDISNGVTFTVTPGPGITSVTPASGGFGTNVSVQGANFGTTQGTSTLTLNGTIIASTSIYGWSATGIGFTLPAGSTTGNVVVTVGGVSSNGVGYTVNSTPTISGLDRYSGYVGEYVVVYGASFGVSQGSSTLTFNGTPATVAYWSESVLETTIPTGATTGPVVVTIGGVASNGVNLTVTPGISALSPTWGPTNTSVTISGVGFGTTQGSSTVTFNGITANATSWSAGSIQATVPGNATTGPVVVTVGGVASIGEYVSTVFTVGTAPHITSISPGSSTVGMPVTLTGTNLGFNGQVSFNGTSVYYYTQSQTQVVVNVPNGATSGNVVVTVTNIGTASNAVNFTVNPGPGLSSLSVPTAGVGASIQISGAGFGTSQSGSTVKFNGTAATPTYWYPTLIIAPVPAGATTGNVVVTVGGVSSNALPFTVAGTPVITSISPTAGGAGSYATITGSNFGTTIGYLNGPFYSGGGIQSWTNTSIVAQIAPQNFNVSEVLTQTVQVYSFASLTWSNGVSFTVLPTPSIASMSPTSGPVGTSVTLTGSYFGATQSSSTVTFNGGVATPTSWSDTSITVPVPSGASSGLIFVTVNGVAAQHNTCAFKVTPVITSLSPSSGTTNTAVTINGTGFGPTIAGGGYDCAFTCSAGSVGFTGSGAHPTAWSPDSIIVPVPNNAATGSVVVTTCGVASNGVTFTVPAGSTGTISGTVTNALTATGTAGITMAAQQSGVTIASALTAVNGTYSIPNLAAGTYDVQATATGYVTALLTGSTVTAGNTTKVNVALSTMPLVNSLSPAWGGTGTVVTIQGANFGPNQADSTGSVTFNAVTATPSNWSNTSITVPVPAGAATGPVVVTVGGEPSTGVIFNVGGGSIKGTVTNASNGQALNGAVVQALLAHVVQGTATTSSNGGYTIANLGPGTYDVIASDSGFGATVTTGQGVTVGNATTVNVALPGAGTDSGSVTNGTTGISGASVSALQNGNVVATATANSSGSFTISNLSAGTYSIQASAQGYAPQTTTGVTVTVGNNTTTNFSLSGQSTVNYEYDALGRLAGVVDSLNGSGVYNYDAVGNITSIQRLSSSQVGVISFIPTSGLVGATVTINGTNFNSNPSQDTVKFNGVTAVVSSASATQLVVTVPSGASSGPIQVTAPGGTGTTSSSFTVWTTATSPVPTITTVSPGVAAVGQTVTITGTNFDPNPLNDSIILDGQVPIPIASASSTSLTFVVPLGVPTGRLTVSDAAGTAISSNYLFVVPSPYTTSQVGYTGQLTSIPGNQTVSLAPNQLGILAFDGTAEQVITLLTSAGTFYGCSVPGTLIGPAGTTIYANNCFGTVETSPLPETGTYSLVLGPDGGIAGQENIAVSNVPAALTGYLLLNGSTGPTVPLNIQTWGQYALFTFNASAQQTATVHIAQNTLPGMHVTVFGPNGAQLATTGQGGSSFTLSVGTLPTTGSYLVQIVPYQGSQYVGTLNLSVTTP